MKQIFGTLYAVYNKDDKALVTITGGVVMPILMFNGFLYRTIFLFANVIHLKKGLPYNRSPLFSLYYIILNYVKLL